LIPRGYLVSIIDVYRQLSPGAHTSVFAALSGRVPADYHLPVTAILDLNAYRYDGAWSRVIDGELVAAAKGTSTGSSTSPAFLC
jgi:hypothetical protein